MNSLTDNLLYSSSSVYLLGRDGVNTLQQSMQNLKLSAPEEQITPVGKDAEPIQFQTNKSYYAINLLPGEANIEEANRAFLSTLECKQVTQEPSLCGTSIS